MVLFPFAVFLVAAAVVLLRTRVLPRWLGWAGVALGLLVGVLGAGLPTGLDIAPLDQAIPLLALAWVAGLAFCLDWLLGSAAGRTGEALD
jgi:prepilin signal peptidase PulO-like enzyme (type II secretory pathway)